jgi:uridine kinase
MTSWQQERAAECKTLVDEIQDFSEELKPNERSFIEDTKERLDKFGNETFISDKQYKWIQDIHERIC